MKLDDFVAETLKQIIKGVVVRRSMVRLKVRI